MGTTSRAEIELNDTFGAFFSPGAAGGDKKLKVPNKIGSGRAANRERGPSPRSSSSAGRQSLDPVTCSAGCAGDHSNGQGAAAPLRQSPGCASKPRTNRSAMLGLAALLVTPALA